MSYRAPLTQAAQQQCCVRGHNAVLHVLPCVLQSCKQEATSQLYSFDLQTSSHLAHKACTFVEIQLLVVLLLFLRLAIVLARVAVDVLGNPLDLPARLLPLAALVQRRLRRFFDKVIGLRLGQDGGLFPLEEQLQTRKQHEKTATQSKTREEAKLRE